MPYAIMMQAIAKNLSKWHGSRLMETADPADWKAFLYWGKVANFWGKF